MRIVKIDELNEAIKNIDQESVMVCFDESTERSIKERKGEKLNPNEDELSKILLQSMRKEEE